MAKTVTFEGKQYSFPDDATNEEMIAALEALTAAPPALPLPEEPAPTPTFEAPLPEREVLAAEREQAAEATQARLETPKAEGAAFAAERARLERERLSTQVSMEAGAEKPTAAREDYILPGPFRATRIREVVPVAPTVGAATAEKVPETGSELDKLRARYRNLENAPLAPEVKAKAQQLVLDRLVSLGAVDALSDDALNARILATGDEKELKALSKEADRREKLRAEEMKAMTPAQVIASMEPPSPPKEGVRMYRDPTTGELREPTAFEELVEAFSKQQVMSEDAARQAGARIARAQSEIDRRIAKGEKVSWTDYAGPLFSGVLSTPESTGLGVTETELGATLRGGLGALSALAAEGYFRGLGYEVDAKGNPVDPEDFGFAIADAKRAINEKAGFTVIPEVVYPFQAVSKPIRALAGLAGGPEWEQTVENLALSVPQLALPTPGVATESTQRKVYDKDPEGRRRVSAIEVPSPLEDPAGFLSAETRRLARNIAAGRTMGDEFMDAPSTRDWYEKVWGDEDAAYWAGSVAEIAIPAGPGTAAKGGKAAGRYLLNTATAAKAAGKVIDAAEVARVAGKPSAMLNVAADAAAAVVPGRPSDARLVRRVAERVIDTMNVSAEAKQAAKASIKPTSATLAEVMDDVGPVLDPEYVSPFRTVQQKGGETLAKEFDAWLANRGEAEARRWAMQTLAQRGGAPVTGTVPLSTLRKSLLGLEEYVAKKAGAPELVSPDVTRVFAGRSPGEIRIPGQQSSVMAVTKEGLRDTNVAMNLIMDADISGPARHFGIQLGRNLPEDMVLISENIAVPRALAKEARDTYNSVKKGLFLRPVSRGAASVQKTLAEAASLFPMAPGSKSARAFKRMEKIVAKAKDDYLTASERAAFDDAHDTWAKQLEAEYDYSMRSFAFPNYFHSRSPKELAQELARTQYNDLAQRLVGALDWRMVDTETLRVLAERVAEPVVMDKLAARARLSRDLTAAQVGFNNWKATFDSPLARRGLALYAKTPFAETVAMRQARQAIRGASETAIRNLGEDLAATARRTGSYDRALNASMGRFEDVVEPDEVWTKVLEAMYGDPELAKAVKAAVIANSQAMSAIGFETVDGVTKFKSFPTIADAKTVDRFFADAGGFKGRSNFRGDLFEPQLGKFGVNGLTSMFAPDYHKAFLKVLLEEGVKKELSQAVKRNEALMSGIDTAMNDPRAFRFGKYEQSLLDRLVQQTKNPLEAKTYEVPGYGAAGSARTRVYDPALSETERLIAESGEGFIRFAESVEPRMRADVLQMAKDGYDWLVLGPGRNMQTMLKYGYMLPNVPYLAAKLLEVPVLSAVTSGLARTSEALSQWPTVMLRRKTGSGLYLPDGRMLTPRQIEELAREQGLGLSTVEAERVGSLADDILRDARVAARRANATWYSAPIQRALDEANPFSKVLGQRFAEAMEISYRQAMFEARLLAGDSIPDAAQAARRSLLDYSETPGVVRDLIGRYVAEAATQWQLTIELARLAAENPSAARVYYKTMKEKQRAEDPFGIHADRSLKSIAMWNLGDGDYYVPGFDKAYMPIEAGLAMARGGVNGLALLGRALNAPEGKGASELSQGVIEGGLTIMREGIHQSLPLIMQAIQAAEEAVAGEAKYSTADVPRAERMSDEGAFWAAAAWAHHMDPDRKGGEWNTFLTLYQPAFIKPPKENAAYPDAKEDDARKFYWKSAPKGTPYLVWGRDSETNETVYKAFKPSESGKLNVAIARKLVLPAIAEKLGWATAANMEAIENPAARPTAVRPMGVVPAVKQDDPKSFLKFFLAPVPEAKAERERQARELSEAVKPK